MPRALLVLTALFAAACSPPTEEAFVAYDDARVPHVSGETDAAAFFGLGYQQARDFPVATLANLWSASGRFATVAGASGLRRDERLLQWGIDEHARAQLTDDALLDPDVRRMLVAFAAGVDAGRAWWVAHPDELDALAGAEGEAMHFDPVPAWLDPFFADDDLRRRLGRLFAEEITPYHVVALGIVLNGGAEFIGGGYALTNVWTVRNGGDDPSTLLLVDSHQPIKRAGARPYMVELSGDTYDVAGYTMPGHPCVLLGYSQDLAFANTSLPQRPRKVAATGAPFRFRGAAPVVASAWTAQLEPGSAASLRVGDEALRLRTRDVTLEYWDVEREELVPDPRGPLTFRSVPAPAPELARRGFEFAVLEPAPDEPLEPGGRIRFEGRGFLAARNPFEFWIRLGRATHVGAGPGGTAELFEEALLCFGRGQAFQAIDARGGMEFLWTSTVPVPGPGALERAPWRTRDAPLLDGNDPTQLWQGFHRYDELPHLLDQGTDDQVWINANDSPHSLRTGGFDDAPFAGRDYVIEPEPWKNRRHDRARELLTRFAADGRLTPDDLERAALDVQDPWARSVWPLVRTLVTDPELSETARGFLAWVDRFRLEDARGEPGEEEFLATPMSQVTVFTVLVRDLYEKRILGLADSQLHEVALGLDPFVPLPDPAAFATDERWERCRGALRSAVEEVARLWSTSVAGEPGGLVNRDVLLGFLPELAAGPLNEAAWLRLLSDEPLAAWGASAPRVPVRWGQVQLNALTPHARRTFPRPLLDHALLTMLAPGRVDGPPFHREMAPLVLPSGGTSNTLYQVHAGGSRSADEGLFPYQDGQLFLRPIDFGTQLPWLVELRPDAAPRCRYLAAMPGTELARDPAHVRTARAFAAGEWRDLEREGKGRVLRLELRLDGTPELLEAREAGATGD